MSGRDLGVRAEWQYACNGHVLSVSEVEKAVYVEEVEIAVCVVRVGTTRSSCCAVILHIAGVGFE